MSTRLRRFRWRTQAGRWMGMLALLPALAVFAGTFDWMAYEFALPRNDLSHGWIVPLFSAYVVWTRRAELRRSASMVISSSIRWSLTGGQVG